MVNLYTFGHFSRFIFCDININFKSQKLVLYFATLRSTANIVFHYYITEKQQICVVTNNKFQFRNAPIRTVITVRNNLVLRLVSISNKAIK